MLSFLALAFAATPSTTAAPMSAWAECMSKHALPLLKDEATNVIVRKGFAACMNQENAVKAAYVHDYGSQTGISVFNGIKFNVQEIMFRRVAQGKKQRGYQ